MHPSVHFFILILVSLSYDQLPKHLSVEARELSSNGAFSFTVDLIHRDSPLSPYHNSSMTPQERRQRATFGSISHSHHFHLSSTFYDEKGNNVDTEISLTPNGPEYLMKISIGTPPVDFIAVADTGSDLMWVQCTPCESCIQQESPLFDPTQSSTYQTIPCNSDQSCSSLDPSGYCNSTSGLCNYNCMYGDGSSSECILSTDTITLTSTDATSTAFPSLKFGCGNDQQGPFGAHEEGIIGLGPGPPSLISQLSPGINYKFSYCLTPRSSGVNSKLKFGSNVIGSGVVSTPISTEDPVPIHYFLSLDGIGIGNTTFPVAQYAMIDSGTTLTYLDKSIYDGVKTALQDAIGLSPLHDPKNISLCYSAEELGGGFNPPDVVFHFQGADVMLKAANTFWTVENQTCLAMAPTNGTFTYGNIAQINYEVGYDLQANLVSFAPKDCTNY